LEKQGIEIELCASLVEASLALDLRVESLDGVLLAWDTKSPLDGFDLLLKCKQLRPSLPVVVVSNTLDVSLATRAFVLGARDFLEKPIDAERLKSCLQNLLTPELEWSPIINQLREIIVGDSLTLIHTLGEIAKLSSHDEISVLLIGESGTGKELLAKSIHELGPRRTKPWVAVNVGAIPPTLIETALFGYEKGAFTDAYGRQPGFLEVAGAGTLFLDEIGDLDLSLQVKLLRVIQEKEFRRVGAVTSLPFSARLVSATNRDLAAAVHEGKFRRDLFHRLAETTLRVPPLREREGDVDILVRHFLNQYQHTRDVHFARETLSILRTYSFPGNVRELQNMIKAALIACEGAEVLPQHLPLHSMGAFLNLDNNDATRSSQEMTAVPGAPRKENHAKLQQELETSMPESWLTLTYREAFSPYEKAFDRVYLSHLLKSCRYNISKASAIAGIDAKTLRKRWKECGLPSLAGDDSDA
jgi:DNA-binding NtrC family response regulator